MRLTRPPVPQSMLFSPCRPILLILPTSQSSIFLRFPICATLPELHVPCQPGSGSSRPSSRHRQSRNSHAWALRAAGRRVLYLSAAFSVENQKAEVEAHPILAARDGSPGRSRFVGAPNGSGDHVHVPVPGVAEKSTEAFFRCANRKCLLVKRAGACPVSGWAGAAPGWRRRDGSAVDGVGKRQLQLSTQMPKMGRNFVRSSLETRAARRVVSNIAQPGEVVGYRTVTGGGRREDWKDGRRVGWEIGRLVDG
jgi:hypothetical protein